MRARTIIATSIERCHDVNARQGVQLLFVARRLGIPLSSAFIAHAVLPAIARDVHRLASHDITTLLLWLSADGIIATHFAADDGASFAASASALRGKLVERVQARPDDFGSRDAIFVLVALRRLDTVIGRTNQRQCDQLANVLLPRALPGVLPSVAAQSAKYRDQASGRRSAERALGGRIAGLRTEQAARERGIVAQVLSPLQTQTLLDLVALLTVDTTRTAGVLPLAAVARRLALLALEERIPAMAAAQLAPLLAMAVASVDGVDNPTAAIVSVIDGALLHVARCVARAMPRSKRNTANAPLPVTNAMASICAQSIAVIGELSGRGYFGSSMPRAPGGRATRATSRVFDVSASGADIFASGRLSLRALVEVLHGGLVSADIGALSALSATQTSMVREGLDRAGLLGPTAERALRDAVTRRDVLQRLLRDE
jgi:hypothetical protein